MSDDLLEPGSTTATMQKVIVAKNRADAKKLCNDFDIRPWFYASRPEVILGINNCFVYFAPGYKEHRMAREIEQAINLCPGIVKIYIDDGMEFYVQ